MTNQRSVVEPEAVLQWKKLRNERARVTRLEDEETQSKETSGRGDLIDAINRTKQMFDRVVRSCWTPSASHRSLEFVWLPRQGSLVANERFGT